MKQQRRYKEPQDTLWGKFLSGFMAVVFAMSTLTLIPIASAINGEPNEAQIQQQEELADQTSGKDEKAADPGYTSLPPTSRSSSLSNCSASPASRTRTMPMMPLRLM